MTKINPQTMKNQYDHQYDTFCRKNHDYGNSFEESLDQFGIVASIVRMSDKMKRLESLTDETKMQQVGSESLLDTLEDLSNYAAMTACWLKGVGAEDEVVETSSYNEDEKKLIELLQRSFHISCHRHEFTMNHKMHDMWDDIINSIANILINENVSQERFEELVVQYNKLDTDPIIYQVKRINIHNEIVNDEEIPPRPMEIPEAVKQLWEAQKQQVDYLFAANNDKEDEKVESFNADFLNMAKTCLNDLFDNIILCRDQNIPLPKRLTYCSYREEKYEQIAALVLTGNIDYSDVARIVNDYPNLRVAEKNHLLQSIVSAAYKISDEPENEKPEFLNKKFHIPDEILKDLKEPERKRTVLGMIFPFRL